jgi:hypothetical protein
MCAAREGLILIQDEPTLRAQVPYVRSLASPDAPPTVAKSLDAGIDGGSLSRADMLQVMRQHHISTDIQHGQLRQLRNRILGVTTLLLAVLTGAAIVCWRFGLVDLLTVMGVGALAGTVTSVLPLARARTPSGPYGVAGAQILLKAPAGAAAAFLGVLLLRKGLGSLNAATGDAALFYAVVFGLAQQTLTQLVDGQAAKLVNGAAPRLATTKPVAEAGSMAHS